MMVADFIMEGGVFTNTVDLSDLTGGVYFVEIKARYEKWQQLLVLE